jgi:hypothetical protein
MDLATRQRLAAESLLENEALRGGLDEAGDAALLNWALTCAEKIIGATAEIEDDDEAEEASYPRMRAMRQMLEQVKSLYRPELEPAEGRALLAEIVGLAATVYGPAAELPKRIFWKVFVATLEGDSGQKINALRAFFEKESDPPLEGE